MIDKYQLGQGRIELFITLNYQAHTALEITHSENLQHPFEIVTRLAVVLMFTSYDICIVFLLLALSKSQ